MFLGCFLQVVHFPKINPRQQPTLLNLQKQYRTLFLNRRQGHQFFSLQQVAATDTQGRKWTEETNHAPFFDTAGLTSRRIVMILPDDISLEITVKCITQMNFCANCRRQHFFADITKNDALVESWSVWQKNPRSNLNRYGRTTKPGGTSCLSRAWRAGWNFSVSDYYRGGIGSWLTLRCNRFEVTRCEWSRLKISL